MRVHKGTALVAGAAAVALALTACGSSGGGNSSKKTGSNKTGSNQNQNASAGTKGTGAFADCASKPNTCNSGQAKPGGTIRYTIEKTVDGWNINFTDHNVFDVAEMEVPAIMPGVYNANPDLKPFLNTDLMDSATSNVANGVQTITYKVKQGAVWNDGQPIGYDDFKYMWDFSDPSHCKDCGPSTTAGYTDIKTMKSSDNGKTITLTMKSPFADWQSMFSQMMPAHLAKAHGYDGTSAGINKSFKWFDTNVPTWSGGPMIITKYQKDTAVTEKPNPKWYGKTKSTLDTLVFRIITDQTQEVPALQNGEVDAIYPQPNTNVLQAVNSLQNVQYWIGKGLNWEHFNLNEKNQFLKDKTLRTAIFTAIDRKAVVQRTIGQFVPGASPTGNHIYMPGQAGYQDNVTSTGQGSGDLSKAKDMLTKAGYKGVGSNLQTPAGKPVSLTCTYSAGNAYRQTECQLMQSALKSLGVNNVKLRTTQDLSELGTGNFDIIVFAWVGAPFVFSSAQQIYTASGGADFAYTYNTDPPAEKLITQANDAAASGDAAKAQQLMNQCDKLLVADAFELPLYQKPTMLAARKTIVNMRDNATSVGPPYNLQDWGLKAS